MLPAAACQRALAVQLSGLSPELAYSAEARVARRVVSELPREERLVEVTLVDAVAARAAREPHGISPRALCWSSGRCERALRRARGAQACCAVKDGEGVGES